MWCNAFAIWCLVYLQQLQKNIPINYKLHIKQVLPVKNLKPAVIKVYDYYQTSKIFLGYVIYTLLLWLHCFHLLILSFRWPVWDRVHLHLCVSFQIFIKDTEKLWRSFVYKF